tara:strand:- start:11542 stop:12720 length:1179 start_codon:yes stop_codon:yes gene_type:complete
MATKIKKEDLFDDGATINSRGYKKNLLTDGEPDQSLVENWAESTAWKTEDGDRATQSTGAELVENLKGLVQVGTDVEAKANTTGLEATTTKVPHTGQLPTVDATDVQLIDGSFQADFNGVALDVAADATATRNNFLVSLTSGFISFLAGITAQISTNIANILTNLNLVTALDVRVTTNEGNITTNEGNITTNTNTINDITANGSLAVRDFTLGTLLPQVNTLKMSTDFDVVDEGSGVALINFVKPIPDATTTTWASFLVNATNIEVSRLNGTGDGYNLTGFDGSIRYMIIDKTLFLSVSAALIINATGKQASGELARIKIKLNKSPINIIPAGGSISTFNANGGGSVYSFDVASSNTNQEIYNVQGLPMPSGNTSLPIIVRGMIAVEIQSFL